MRSTFVALGALAIVAAVVLTGYFAPHADASTGPIPLNCNRACLENLVDQYLAAVVAHDPKRLPLSADVKYTENDQLMELGDGFWKTAQARGKYTHIWADPEFGQVAYMGTMREAGAAAPDEFAPARRTGAHHRNRKRLTSSPVAAVRTTSPGWTRPTSPRTCGSSRFRPPNRCPARN